jgi:hypothetical protein
MTTAASCPAWQPLTFGGVASFASATFTRLWIVQFLVSLLVAGSVAWLLKTGWFPVVSKAIDALPEEAVIHHRRLVWSDSPSAPLSENSFLSIRVNPEASASSNPGGDVQVVLGNTGLRIASLLGFVEVPYPTGWTMSLNRADARAWWEARRTFLLIGAGLTTVLALFLSWTILAFLYWLPAWLIAFYLDRVVTGWGCWRLAGAAVLPGAFIMSGAILLYSSRRLDPVGVLFAWLLHILIGWVYLAYAPTRLPRLKGPTRRGNPFRSNKTKA